MSNNLYDNFPELKNNLQEVSNLIQLKLETSEEKFSETVQRVFNKNSKMIRPALCLIATSPNKKIRKKAIRLAAAIELMHVASLVHDDIIDNAKVRRNLPTINYEFDDGYAVICGDYLFAKSFELIVENKLSKNFALMTDNLTTMVFGEVEQYLDKFDEEISIERYFSIISKKTASFFSTSLVLGANLAKLKEEEIELLENIGKSMGILFQIQDDLLDFSDESQIGKSSMSDINRGIYSLPVIIALEKSTEFKSYLKHSKEYDFTYILETLKKTDSLVITNNYIDDYYHKTMDDIHKLSNKEVVKMLEHLINNLMNRKK